MRDAVTGRQIVGLPDSDAEAVDPMATRAHQDRPLLSHQPRTQPTALEGNTSLIEQVSRLMAQQVPEDYRDVLMLRDQIDVPVREQLIVELYSK